MQPDQTRTGGNRDMAWGSDVVAEILRRLDINYIAVNPWAGFRCFHDSLVNYLENRDPSMLLVLHEESRDAIAHGHAKVTGQSMALEAVWD